MENLKETILTLEISDKSKKVYLSLLNRLGKNKFKFPVKSPEKQDYIQEFLGQFPKYSTKLDMLNVIIVIRNSKDLKTERLKELRKAYQKERISDNVEVMNKKGKELLTLEQFKEKMDQAFNKEQYDKYIINYLWSTYGVRSADVDVEIVKSKKAMIDKKQNYLYLGKAGVKYIRNNYKTISTYGEKTHAIEDDKFIKSVKQLGLGNVLSKGQIGNALRKLMIDSHNESDVFKLIIDDAYDKEDTERINQLSDTRGTNISTVKSFYNVNASQDIIREL